MNLTDPQEESQMLFKELKHQEELFKSLISQVQEFIQKTRLELKTQSELNEFLKDKLETTVIKLNNYKQCKFDLLRQNKELIEKNQSLGDALDEEQKKTEEYVAKLSLVQETMESKEQVKHINRVLNTEQSLENYVKEHRAEIKRNFPHIFCECDGNYFSLKRNLAEAMEKIKADQEKIHLLETCNKNLSETVFHLKEENQRLQQKSLRFLSSEKKKENLFLIISPSESTEMSEKQSNFKKNKRTASLGIRNEGKTEEHLENSKKKNLSLKSSENTAKKNIPGLSSFGTAEFKEGPHTLLSDLESSSITVSKHDTKELINSQGFSEYLMSQKQQILDKFDQMELDSPIILEKYTKTFEFKSIKVEKVDEDRPTKKKIERIEVLKNKKDSRASLKDFAIFGVFALGRLCYRAVTGIASKIV